jgi:phosphoenolpyruvate synthase/pyruvate phosphate dikinase
MDQKDYWLKNFSENKHFIQELPGMFHAADYVGVAAVSKIKKYFPNVNKKIFMLCNQNYLYWCYDSNDVLAEAKDFVTKVMASPSYLVEIFNQWREIEKEFYHLLMRLDKIDFTNLSLLEMKELYHQFKELYTEEYSSPMICDQTSFYAEIKIVEKLKEITKGDRDKLREYLSTLSLPVSEFFLSKEQYDLYTIILNFIDKNKKEVFLLSLDELKRTIDPLDLKEIQEHAQKYHWIQNNYLNIEKLSVDFFINRIKEHMLDESKVKNYVDNYFSILEKNKEEKAALVEELDLDLELKTILKISDLHGYWQDLRKKANITANYYVKLFMEVASKKTNVSFNEISMLTVDEFELLLKKGKLDLDFVKERKGEHAVVYLADERVHYQGGQAKKLFEIMQNKENVDNIVDFRGTPVSTGKVVATARIILDPNNDTLKEGEILITGMTRPEFVPLMKKAVAVVTNEGGMTRHAAIISRELGLPCIVGTKIATKAIKDGDIIEVNANHGVVKILERFTS